MSAQEGTMKVFLTPAGIGPVGTTAFEVEKETKTGEIACLK